MAFNLLDDFMKFMSGNPDDPAQNSILQNMGLAANSQTNPTINELRSNMNGRAVNPLSEPWLGSVLPYPGMDPNMPGRAVLQEQPQPPPQPPTPPQDGMMANTPVGDGAMQRAPDPMGMGQQASIENPRSITIAPPPPPPQPQEAPRPPRGMMESFIEQLPELALSGFANIGRGGMRYGGTGGYIGLGALRGLQGMAMPFAKSLHDDRIQARKESDARQAAEALARNPADPATQAMAALRLPVGEMAVLDKRRLDAEQRERTNEAIKLAAPELATLPPALRALHIARAQAGHFEGIVDTITGMQVPVETRQRITAGETLTGPDLVAIGRLPSQAQEKLFEVNARAAQRILDRYPKIGSTHKVAHDGPDGGTVQERMFKGLDAQGKPVYENLGDPVPRFKPGTSVEDRMKQVQYMQVQSAIVARQQRELDKDTEKFKQMEIDGPDEATTKDAAKKLAWDNQLAKKKLELERREEKLREMSDQILMQPEMTERRTDPKGAPKPPPGGATGTQFESLPPAAQWKDKEFEDSKTGKRMRSDGTKWIAAQ